MEGEQHRYTVLGFIQVRFEQVKESSTGISAVICLYPRGIPVFYSSRSPQLKAMTPSSFDQLRPTTK